MAIDLKTVKHISKLARISLDDKKAKKLAGDLNSIFEFFLRLMLVREFVKHRLLSRHLKCSIIFILEFSFKSILLRYCMKLFFLFFDRNITSIHASI